MLGLQSCPTMKMLKYFVLGTLDPVDTAQVVQHLRVCDSCLTKVEELEGKRKAVPQLVTAGPEQVSDNYLAKLSSIPSTAINEILETINHDSQDFEGDGLRELRFLNPPEGPDEIGRLGGYRIFSILGSGGMGVVFAGEDLRLKRKVAIKAMRYGPAMNPVSRQRFIREAEATAALHSDHVVSIYQIGEDEEVPYIVMEFLEGESLEERIRRCGRLSCDECLRIGREIALGLAAAHEQGVIHRDVKPANIWLESRLNDRIKLLDFGLARPSVDHVHLTHTGLIVGTPAYMSPEQARGLPVDYRSDLFSIGVVLYRLSTGINPFQGNTTMAILTSLALDIPRPIHEVNPELPAMFSDLVQKLLNKDPRKRPESALQVVQMIDEIENHLYFLQNANRGRDSIFETPLINMNGNNTILSHSSKRLPTRRSGKLSRPALTTPPDSAAPSPTDESIRSKVSLSPNLNAGINGHPKPQALPEIKNKETSRLPKLTKRTPLPDTRLSPHECSSSVIPYVQSNRMESLRDSREILPKTKDIAINVYSVKDEPTVEYSPKSYDWARIISLATITALTVATVSLLLSA